MADEEKKEMPFITKALIVAILSIVVVVVSTGVAFFVANRAVQRNIIAQGEEQAEDKKKADSESDEEYVVGTMIDFGEYTINLREEEPRYLVCKIQVEVDVSGKDKGKKGAAELEDAAKKVVIQDKLITILKSKSIADLNADPSLEQLRKEMIASINSILQEGKAKNIYFGSWMVQ